MAGVGFRHAYAVCSMITPILGGSIDAEQQRARLHRSSDGRVALVAGGWLQLLEFGAKAFGRYQRLVRQVKIDPAVLYRGDTSLTVYRRPRGDDGFMDHEAITGLIGVNMLLPVEIMLPDLKEVLDLGGRYVGFAPQRWAEGFGRFTVVSVGEGRCADM